MQKCLAMKRKGFLVGDFRKQFSKTYQTSMEQESKSLEAKLRLDPKKLDKKNEFVMPWYQGGSKARKQKLGSLYHCEVEGRTDILCRVVNCKRIAEYQIDAYFTQLARY